MMSKPSQQALGLLCLVSGKPGLFGGLLPGNIREGTHPDVSPAAPIRVQPSTRLMWLDRDSRNSRWQTGMVDEGRARQVTG